MHPLHPPAYGHTSTPPRDTYIVLFDQYQANYAHYFVPIISDSGDLPHLREICPQIYNVNSGIMKVLVFLLSVRPEIEQKPIL